jgi:hypothetical protein
MEKCLILAIATGVLQAAVIQGTVVENQTGHPLARATVRLDPIAGTPGTGRSVRTDRGGNFGFTGLSAGAYLLTSSRIGFATIQYGQKQWQSAGVPVVVTENDSFAFIRLPRLGAISGTVLDENSVGLPDHEVVAYRNTRPPQLVGARARSDDRGVFRISGLEPGSYLVRSVGKQYEDSSYLPTFSRETQTLDQSFPVRVDLDTEVDRADVRPLTGRLFTLTVEATTIPPNPTEPLPVTMTLASELGREVVQANFHRFGPLPAGQYEVFLRAPLDRSPGFQGEYRRITVNQDTSLKIVLRQENETRFTFDGAPNPGSIRVLARRVDLAGPGDSEVLKLTNNRVQLPSGPWQFAVQPNPAFYVSGFSGPRVPPPVDQRPDGWNDIVVGEASSVKFTLSSNPGALNGTVRSGGRPVVGAPVFLEPTDLEPLRRVTNVLATRTDIQGNYYFTGLTPGKYRILSTFEYTVVDSAILSNARANQFEVEKGQNLQRDLDLYVVP